MKKIKLNIVGTKKMADFAAFSKIENDQLSIGIQTGFYFINSKFLKNGKFYDQFYFCNDKNEIFYLSYFNQWCRSKNKQEFFNDKLLTLI